MAASWMAASDPSLCKTPLGETGCLCIFFFFFWSLRHVNSRLVFVHAKTPKILLVVKILIKKYRAAATLISSHENTEEEPH